MPSTSPASAADAPATAAAPSTTRRSRVSSATRANATCARSSGGRGGVRGARRARRRHPLAVAVGWILAVPLGDLGAAIATRPRRAEHLMRREGRGKLGTLFASVVTGLVIVRHLLGRPMRHAEAVAGAALYWAGLMICLWASLRAFGYSLAPVGVVLGFATGYVATPPPNSPQAARAASTRR